MREKSLRSWFRYNTPRCLSFGQNAPKGIADQIDAIIWSEQKRAEQEKRDVPKLSQIVVHILRLGVETYWEKEGENRRRP